MMGLFARRDIHYVLHLASRGSRSRRVIMNTSYYVNMFHRLDSKVNRRILGYVDFLILGDKKNGQNSLSSFCAKNLELD